MKDITSNLEASIAEFLGCFETNSSRDGLAETPKRFVRQIQECLSGYNDDPKRHLKLFDNEDFHDLIVVSAISFSSLCEHHLLPFYGSVDIGYLPKDKILGLSKFARIVDALSKRLQIQERLTQQLADFFAEHLASDLVLVRMRAHHTCMIIRGVSRPESITETFTIVGDTAGKTDYVQHFNQLVQKSSL
jgi:GTP cyclohydrolase IA